MTRLTKSQAALQTELRDVLTAIPDDDRLPWLRSALLDIEPPENLEQWVDSLSSATANDRHYKRMDTFGSMEIAMMGRG